MQANPYQAPDSELSAAPTRVAGDGAVGAGVVAELRRTRPWILLMAVLGCLVALLMFIGGMSTLTEASDGGIGASMQLPLGGMMVLIAFGTGGASVHLFRYASSIARLTAGGDEPVLEAAMGHQRRFWTMGALLTLAIIVLYAAISLFAYLTFMRISNEIRNESVSEFRTTH